MERELTTTKFVLPRRPHGRTPYPRQNAMDILHYTTLTDHGASADFFSGRGLSAHHRFTGGSFEDVTWNMDYCLVGDKLDDDMLDDEDNDGKKKSKAAILVT